MDGRAERPATHNLPVLFLFSSFARCQIDRASTGFFIGSGADDQVKAHLNIIAVGDFIG